MNQSRDRFHLLRLVAFLSSWEKPRKLARSPTLKFIEVRFGSSAFASTRRVPLPVRRLSSRYLSHGDSSRRFATSSHSFGHRRVEREAQGSISLVESRCSTRPRLFASSGFAGDIERGPQRGSETKENDDTSLKRSIRQVRRRSKETLRCFYKVTYDFS